MKRVGAHVSASGGVSNAPLNAKKIGADAFALFCKNQRQWEAKPLEQSEILKFKQNLKIANISPNHILPHDSYLINLGHPDEILRQKSLNAFIDETNRAEILGLKLLNFHPGSHLKLISEDECLKNIANSINYAINLTSNIKFVIENTAGQGSNLGFTFEQIAKIISQIKNQKRIGVCLDTCHLFAAGYDIKSDYSGVMKEFDRMIGYDFLSGMHLNDAKSTLNSKVDRHESLGAGNIGLDTFRQIMQDSKIDEIPMILETIDENLWAKEIEILRNFIKD